MGRIELNDGSSVKCKALSKSEYDRIVKDSVGGVIQQLQEQYDIDVHKLKNNQIVVKEEEYYTLYYSLDDLEKVLQDSAPPGGGVEILRNKNIYGSKFPEETVQLVTQLCTDLNIAKREPDNELLRNVDERLNVLKDPDDFNEKHLMHFIALIGQVLIRENNAKWHMKLASDGETWNPYLVIDGNQVQFFTYLYEDIFLDQTIKKICWLKYMRL